MKKTQMLSVQNLSADAGGKEILHNINLNVPNGEVHVVMGPNGSGKSTLLYVLMGHPAYAVSSPKSKIILDGMNITHIPTEERAKKGVFLALQSPIAIPGVSVLQIIRSALSEREISHDGKRGNGQKHNPVLSVPRSIAGKTMLEFTKSVQSAAGTLRIDKELLTRGIHDGFSGGERKKTEVLEAFMLEPKLALFDEIDTGLDVDALKTVAEGIVSLKKKGTTVLIVTHYQRILRHLVPDRVHVLMHGSVLASGDAALAHEIDRKGYASYAGTIPTR